MLLQYERHDRKQEAWGGGETYDAIASKEFSNVGRKKERISEVSTVEDAHCQHSTWPSHFHLSIWSLPCTCAADKAQMDPPQAWPGPYLLPLGHSPQPPPQPSDPPSIPISGCLIIFQDR